MVLNALLVVEPYEGDISKSATCTHVSVNRPRLSRDSHMCHTQSIQWTP